MRPFALHITWTCYGTWLPGDERGHVSNIIDPTVGSHPKQNIPGTPCSPGDEYTHRYAANLQKSETVWLTADQAFCACNAIVEAALKRGWLIVRAAAMPNHVHCGVMDCPNDGPLVRRILKGVSQAALSDLVGRNQRWWTAKGSDRYKNDDRAIANMIQYIEDQPYQLARIVDNVASVVPPG